MNTDKNQIASILVVDDMPKNIQVLGNLLRQSHYNVEFATNGPEALEWVKAYKFDLILLDIMMPGMNGIEVCKILKSNQETKDIPVIFLTAKTDSKDITLGFKVGAIDYITKPFNIDELIARVTTHLKIQSQNKELLYQNSFKNVLMSVIAHDLRTPLSIISNMISVAKLKKEQQKINELGETLEIIDSSIKESFLIVNDLLAWGKVQFGKLKINNTSFNLFALVNEIIFAFATVAEEKSIIVNNQISAEIFIKTDKELLKIILRNLIINGIKFTPTKGNIKITYDNTDDNLHLITVIDSGIGIDKIKLEQLFSTDQENFKINTFTESGMGLGLFLIKDILRFLNGNIQVNSEVGKGSVFQIYLPVL